MCAVRNRSIGMASLLLGIVAVAGQLRAGNEWYEQDPINYSKTAVGDPIAQLQRRIASGKAKLDFTEAHGYLPAVLRELKIPVSSQTLVFSKTSFQREAIAPATPRALYFNDDSYIGWCYGGEVVEIATTDPLAGTIFYTLDQREVAKPKFVRQIDNCLQCHASSMTRDVPGLMVRSVFVDPRGQPILNAGTLLNTQESPFKERFGGWYVSGQHGDMRHMGNLLGQDRDNPDPIDPEAGANLVDLSRKFDTAPYLSGHSDLVALMVLAHQAEVHNFLSLANYSARLALRDAKVLNEALHEPPGQLSEGCVRRIQNPAETLLKCMLFTKEAALTAPISGTAGFTEQFMQRGPKDSKGRSLRDLDLKRRLFKYPCSYLIYSDSFDALPELTREHFYRKLYDVLTEKDKSEDFASLSSDDRRAILEILRETKEGLPEYWK